MYTGRSRTWDGVNAALANFVHLTCGSQVHHRVRAAGLGARECVFVAQMELGVIYPHNSTNTCKFEKRQKKVMARGNTLTTAARRLGTLRGTLLGELRGGLRFQAIRPPWHDSNYSF
jgi:hypothetical protein